MTPEELELLLASDPIDAIPIDPMVGEQAGAGTDERWDGRDYSFPLLTGSGDPFSDANGNGNAGVTLQILNDTRNDGDNVFIIRFQDATPNLGFANDGVFEFNEAPTGVTYFSEGDYQYHQTDLELTTNIAYQTAIVLIQDDDSPNNRINGTSSADNRMGTNSRDTIRLYGGNDTANAGGGNDIVLGEAGNDTLRGEDGDDALLGGLGSDSLVGGNGTDTLNGGEDGDTLNGDAGNDSLDGGAGNDSLFGGADDDTLEGNAGSDSLDGGAGSDVIRGGASGSEPGNDTLVGGAGNDRLDGMAGNDSLYGGTGDDSLYGDDGNDRLEGGDGSDTLDGGAGADTLIGGTGNDLYVIDNLDDQIIDSRGTGIETVQVFSRTSYTLGEGLDFLDLSNVQNGFGNDLDNRISADGLDNWLEGREGNDTLEGGNGDDSLYGGAGNDLIVGGFDYDLIDGGTGNDTTSYSYYTGSINANLGAGLVSFAGEAGTETLISIENLIGADGNDTILGSAGNNLLDGGDGNDRLNGYGTVVNNNSQFDTLTGGTGSDTFVLGSAAGVFYNETGDGYAVITDWDAPSGIGDTVFDRIEVRGSISQYRLDKARNVVGGAGVDTEIYYIPTGDRIAIVQDTINVQLNRDFVYL